MSPGTAFCRSGAVFALSSVCTFATAAGEWPLVNLSVAVVVLGQAAMRKDLSPLHASVACGGKVNC